MEITLLSKTGGTKGLDIIKDAYITSEVADILVDSNVYIADLNLIPENYFTRKSGTRAPVYCDVRKLFYDGKRANKVSEIIT